MNSDFLKRPCAFVQGLFYEREKEAAMVLTVQTGSKTEMIDITEKVREAVRSSGVANGVCMVFVPHTTAAVTINESADPSVRRDIMMVLNQIVPWKADYRHMEGNSPAHVKTSLVGSSEWIAVEDGRLVLGTWQGIFFCEFDGPRSRKVHVRMVKA
jgi:secondary thiamine-phosphate synthase enzyme